jgi:hypothetical protein
MNELTFYTETGAALPRLDASAVFMAKREGAVFRIGKGHRVYMVLDGKARWIPNPRTYTNLFTNWKIIQSWP